MFIMSFLTIGWLVCLYFLLFFWLITMSLLVSERSFISMALRGPQNQFIDWFLQSDTYLKVTFDSYREIFAAIHRFSTSPQIHQMINEKPPLGLTIETSVSQYDLQIWIVCRFWLVLEQFAWLIKVSLVESLGAGGNRPSTVAGGILWWLGTPMKL